MEFWSISCHILRSLASWEGQQPLFAFNNWKAFLVWSILLRILIWYPLFVSSWRIEKRYRYSNININIYTKQIYFNWKNYKQYNYTGLMKAPYIIDFFVNWYILICPASLDLHVWFDKNTWPVFLLCLLLQTHVNILCYRCLWLFLSNTCMLCQFKALY